MGDHKVISVLGSGWSFKGLDATRLPGLTIGINQAGLQGKTDIVVSMDRLWTEARWGALQARAGLTWIRDTALKNVADRPGWLTVFTCDHKTYKFTDEPISLNGTNSGLCGFNLAYKLRPKIIYLVAFDMCASPTGEIYWHDPHEWKTITRKSAGKYPAWARHFQHGAEICFRAGIKVINASLESQIQGLEKVDPRSIMQ